MTLFLALSYLLNESYAITPPYVHCKEKNDYESVH